MQAGLLLAETEYALQVESDIAPYRGLLLGLFFMTVGMEISGALFVAKWKTILVTPLPPPPPRALCPGQPLRQLSMNDPALSPRRPALPC